MGSLKIIDKVSPVEATPSKMDEPEWREGQPAIEYFIRHHRYVCVIVHTRIHNCTYVLLSDFCYSVVLDTNGTSVILSAARASEGDAGVRIQEAYSSGETVVKRRKI